jgi:hypothetical protein
LVERDLAKVEVAGSKPVSRTNSPSLALVLVVAGDGTTLNVGRRWRPWRSSFSFQVAECAVR